MKEKCPLNGETYYFSNLYDILLAAQLVVLTTPDNHHLCMVIFLHLNLLQPIFVCCDLLGTADISLLAL